MSQPPEALHEQAERIVRALVQRFGTRMPEDVETILSYYISCRRTCDRAAQDVIALRRLAEGK